MTTTPNDLNDNTAGGDELTYDQIMALSANMYKNMYVMENGKVRQLDPAIDTKVIYFEKTRIDALFAANPGSDGLKIFLALVDPAIFTPDDPRYNNKLSVVLVTSTGMVNNLDKNLKPENIVIGSGGTGMDFGALCPPNPIC